MAEVKLPVDLLKVAIEADCLHRPGAVRLDDYPHLVYAPLQHGDHVALEDTGTPVADIAVAAAETPDHAKLAEKFKTTPEHVAAALRYATAVGSTVAP